MILEFNLPRKAQIRTRHQSVQDSDLLLVEHRNTIDARPQSVGYLYNAIFQQLQSYRKAYYFDTIHLKNMCYHP